MANRTLNTRLRLKYDTAANWATKNPVLLAGEVGIESDTLLGKVGDGTKAWQQLEYLNAGFAKQLGYGLDIEANTGYEDDIAGFIFDGTTNLTLIFDRDYFTGYWPEDDSTGEIDQSSLIVQLKKTLTDKINGALRFDIAQSLTDDQKAQVRANIGASGTDTGATSVEVTGNGNAVTDASYSASTRKLTLTKGATFLTANDISGLQNKITALERKPGLDKVGTVTSINANGTSFNPDATGKIDLGSIGSTGPLQFSDVVVMTEAEFSEAYLAGTLQDDKLYLIEGETGTVNFVSTADHIVYSNTNSGLTATNVQLAIDEVKSKLFSGSYNDLTDKPSELTKEALLILLQLTSEQLTKLIAFADKITVDSTGVEVSGVLKATSFDTQ